MKIGRKIVMLMIVRLYPKTDISRVWNYVENELKDFKSENITPLYATQSEGMMNVGLIFDVNEPDNLSEFITEEIIKCDEVHHTKTISLMKPVFFPIPKKKPENIQRYLIRIYAHPKYYKKVVNNLNDIELNTKTCRYMCVMHYREIKNFWDLLLAERKAMSHPKLIVNPRTMNYYKTDYDLAATLVHEADHIEYMKSNRLRKITLFIKCNPALNPKISIESRLDDLQHRIDPMEICAEKEEIKFHQTTNTPSAYEIKHGIIYNFFSFLINEIKSFAQIIF